jgi:hypothetical protein
MIGGIEETSASSKPDPRLDPTRLRGALRNERPYRDLKRPVRYDPPPLKWSDLKYVFDIREDCNGKEAIQA